MTLNGKQIKFTIQGSQLGKITGSSIGAAAVLSLRNLYDANFKNDKIVATGNVKEDGAIHEVMYVSLKALAAERNGLKFIYPRKNENHIQPQILHDCDIEAVSSVNDLLTKVFIDFIWLKFDNSPNYLSIFFTFSLDFPMKFLAASASNSSKLWGSRRSNMQVSSLNILYFLELIHN